MKVSRNIIFTLSCFALIGISEFFIYLFVATYRNSIKNCYPYICEAKTLSGGEGIFTKGCYTQIYYYSEKCLNNDTFCDKILFKGCNAFACTEFSNSSCSREGKFICYHLGEITNQTNVDDACLLQGMLSDCNDQEAFWEILYLMLILLIIIDILIMKHIHSIVYKVDKTDTVNTVNTVNKVDEEGDESLIPITPK